MRRKIAAAKNCENNPFDENFELNNDKFYDEFSMKICKNEDDDGIEFDQIEFEQYDESNPDHCIYSTSILFLNKNKMNLCSFIF